ncbi:FMN-binding negative transcriptional regulator [Segniliparus rotundus DSM 44985]|uniref:FMN-binding negative transcriptional regulator n=1 Tax=Segniliparus rotundus (strain ATCC BAA-972 / CDC 1076 / CIP 108378 / DSM 44985 / JCM 13578) TaxID=640132 RepID=D6ZDH2_SEGRD|nr:FMN-binding negative transcriptional regulator [Segniliparus rotundus]ADG97236.1 FMN-binding negative transcriptional regulator [Segniliparus rotundus DSM 44985]
MYNPRPHQVHDEAAIRAFVAQVGSGTLVTASPARIEATLLPILWSGDTVVAHLAKANPQAAAISSGAPGLWVVQGPEAYVSPGWYASKREHGAGGRARVVPTWNYSVVQLRGRVCVRDDAAWVRSVVSQLTDVQEQAMSTPWGVGDAPEEYIDGQLCAIVGVEMRVESVEAKAKWSQNRSAADKAGVLAGLRDQGAAAAAEHMAAVLAVSGEQGA